MNNCWLAPYALAVPSAHELVNKWRSFVQLLKTLTLLRFGTEIS